MSDFFGIGAGVKAVVNLYSITARRSGRTISLINSLKDGDRVIFDSEREARRVQRLAKDRGINLDYLVVNPDNPEALYQYRMSSGRTIFDHVWVEAFYKNSLQYSHEWIEKAQTRLSGCDEKHIQTPHKAKEINKFREWL